MNLQAGCTVMSLILLPMPVPNQLVRVELLGAKGDLNLYKIHIHLGSIDIRCKNELDYSFIGKSTPAV